MNIFAVQMSFEALLLAFALYACVIHLKDTIAGHQYHMQSLGTIIFRDTIFYFLAAFGSYLASYLVMRYSLKDANISMFITLVVQIILGTRLVLNLRKSYFGRNYTSEWGDLTEWRFSMNSLS